MNATTEAQATKAYLVPFVVFMGFLLLLQFGGPLIEWNHPAADWWQRAPEQLIYPIQSLVCFTLVLCWRKNIHWEWKLKPCLIGMIFGIAGISCWLAPTFIADSLPNGVAAWAGNPEWPWYKYLLGLDSRIEGFNPAEVFGDSGAMYYGAMVMRFFRAVVVVALVEELFWRGWLMRLLVNSDYMWKVPFGTHSWRAYWVTTVCFMAVHQPVDYLGAFVYGSLAYLLTVKIKNLGAVIVMHAVANLVLGIVAVSFGKYGLW